MFFLTDNSNPGKDPEQIELKYKPGRNTNGTAILKKQILQYLINIYSEKAMAPHSSTLAWKIPWVEEPGRLQSMGSLRIGQD